MYTKVMPVYSAIRMDLNKYMYQMRILTGLIVGCCLLVLPLFSQQADELLKGEVSFVSVRNVYVKFVNTAKIQQGDTLWLESRKQACLQVLDKSSTSCVCKLIGNCETSKGDAVYIRLKPPFPTDTLTEIKKEQETKIPPEPIDVETSEVKSLNKERIRGRISLSSYSNIASQRDNRNRLMGRFSLHTQNIRNSGFSFQTYMNYRQINPAIPENFLLQQRYFRVYNLAITYTGSQQLSVVLGRRINPKIASLGAIDGLQVEKHFGRFYAGAIAGSRPDILSHAYNPRLLVYGGYAGLQSSKSALFSQTTAGFIEQRNRGMVDRRYAYFQHSSTIARKLTLFSSAEMDVYSVVNGVRNNQIRFPNLFVSTTYRFNRKLRLMLSYDSRRRVLYYETFQTEIERLLNDDLARQGVRIRVNVRPAKYLFAGASYSRRFQSDQQNKSDNIHAFIGWSKLPAVGGRITLTFNQNASNYLMSQILSTRYSRSVIPKRLRGDFYYRRVNYVFVNSGRKRLQNYVGTQLNFQISKKLTFHLAAESSWFNQENNHRVYARIIRRIYGKERNK